MVTTNESDADKDLWSLVLSMDSKDKSDNKDKSVLVGPTYKIEITVEGVRTRALLDHGAQVTIVRRQLLGKVKERQKWPVETCRSKEIRATGTELGAVGAVRLNMVVDATQDLMLRTRFPVARRTTRLWSFVRDKCPYQVWN